MYMCLSGGLFKLVSLFKRMLVQFVVFGLCAARRLLHSSMDGWIVVIMAYKMCDGRFVRC